MINIKVSNNEGIELNIVRELFLEYQKELDANLAFQHFDEELKNPLKKYGEPYGALFLGYWNGEPAGCIGLAPMEQKGFCEMKRLYVRAPFRKYGIGKTLVEHIISVAAAKNYHTMRLDTFKKLQSAIRLYENFGFYYIESYYHNPFSDVVFMEKKLL